ncbi:hypothetical protein PMAYCL1PPCAC_23350, partial [Pristionchus mayeri]
SVTDGRLECGDGWAILVMEGNSLILDTKSECKNKRWFINEKPFPKQVEATCGSIVRRNDRTQAADAEVVPSTPPSREKVIAACREYWGTRFKEVQERITENDRVRRRLVLSLEELRKRGEMDREARNRIQKEVEGHNTIHRELNLLINSLRQERGHELAVLRTTEKRIPIENRPLQSTPHTPSYAELLALQGYEAMPQIYGSRPSNSLDGIQSIDGLPLPLKPYTSHRRCGTVRQSSSECPDGRVCSPFSHLGEHRINCPRGHIAVEVPEGHLELMVSSLVCPEGESEWMAENSQGQRGQRVGADVTVTCIQECACTPLSASPVCPPSQRCSPASFLVDMDDQCMLYECAEGKTLFIRTRYGWQPASHLVCGPRGDYLHEGKDNVGPYPTVTCAAEGESLYSSHHTRRVSRRMKNGN